jgi:hypothetical protein
MRLAFLKAGELKGAAFATSALLIGAMTLIGLPGINTWI